MKGGKRGLIIRQCVSVYVCVWCVYVIKIDDGVNTSRRRPAAPNLLEGETELLIIVHINIDDKAADINCYLPN